MTPVSKTIIWIFSLLAIAGVGIGAARSLHSTLFQLKRVEVAHLNSTGLLNFPLNDQTVIRLAGIPSSGIGLFDVNISSIEHQLLAQEWIQDVRVQKRFPDTLLIAISLREPKAIFQTAKGSLVYVDSLGKIFGSVNFVNPTVDLPILVGFSDSTKIHQALWLLDRWSHSDLNRLSWVSSVIWDSSKGYRMLIRYSMGSSGDQMRAIIDLGQEIDENINEKILHLSSVFRYLIGRSIATHQIWADAGKKVVVKTVSGS